MSSKREKAKTTPQSSGATANQDSTRHEDTEGACPIVAIGASAEGLEALKPFFDAVPPDGGLAFVLIQHLAPDRESLTASQLASHAKMPVREIEEAMSVEPNHVYVIPPGKFLTIQAHRLHLSEPVLSEGKKLPIDDFFRSLARECRERVVGILLSGTGTDAPLERVAISVSPADRTPEGKGLWLVAFEEEPEPSPKLATATDIGDSRKDVIRQLEQELRDTRDELQGTIEELESAKEDLQSMNEELNTVNAQLQCKLEELETLNNDLNNLLESTEIASLFLDRESRIKRFTPATRNLFNLIASDLDRPLSDISHRFTDNDLLEKAGMVLETLSATDDEVRTVEGGWYMRRIRPYRTARGRIDGVVITFVDITELKEKEQRLRRLATVALDSNDAVTVLDFAGNVQEWNRGAERMYGWSREEILGKSLFDLGLVPEEGRESTAELLQRLRNEERIEAIESVRLTRDKRLLPVSVTATPLSDENSTPVAIATTERDISAHKQAESTLRESKQKAEAMNAQKTRFLAAASHDLRQPLQFLLLTNTMLRRELKGKGRLDLLDQQDGILTVMTALLDDLLDISQLEVGKLRVNRKAFCISDLLTPLQREFSHFSGAKGLELRVRPCHRAVYSDPMLLQRVLQNLLANAVKYTDRGRILVGCRRRGNNLRIEVWDTGKGIPPQEIEPIFNEFYQVDNPARDRQQGLGLGLAIAQRIAAALGHRLDVRSTPGKGSVFALEAPLSSRAEAGENPEKTWNAGEAPEKRSVKVVLIEDDRLVGFSLKRLMEAEGFEVAHLSQGDQVMEKIKSGELSPDILVSDYRLPGAHNGLEIIGQVREILARRIPAILLTGDTVTLQQLNLESGNCQLIYKPVDGDKLIAHIRQLI